MRRVCKFSWLALALVLSIAGCVPPGGSGGAGAEKAAHPLGRKTSSQLREAAGYMQKKQWDKALAELETDTSKLNPYEKARVLELRARILLLSDKVPQGISTLEEAVALKAMPPGEQGQAEYLLGHAYMNQERFAEAAAVFEEWLKKAKAPEAENYFDVARAYARAKRLREALPHAKKAVELDAKPDATHLELLAWIQVELKQYADSAAVQEKLVQAFPTKQRWLQLSQTYLDMKNNAKAVEALEVPYNKGELTDEEELVTMARLYQKAGAPLKGAELLQKHMDGGKVAKTPQHMELLASCLIAAGDTERGSAALEAVGNQVSSGQVYLDLGRAHVNKQSWEPARDALAKAVITGGLRFPGSAQLLLGITHYKMNRKDAALASLAQAKRYPSANKCAEDWIKAIKKRKKDAAEADCSATILATTDPKPVPKAKAADPNKAAGAADPAPKGPDAKSSAQKAPGTKSASAKAADAKPVAK